MNRRGFKTAVGVGLSVMLAASAMSGCSKAGNEDAVKTEAAKAEDTKSAGRQRNYADSRILGIIRRGQGSTGCGGGN